MTDDQNITPTPNGANGANGNGANSTKKPVVGPAPTNAAASGVGADVPMMADIPGSSVRSGMPAVADSHSISGPVPVSSVNTPVDIPLNIPAESVDGKNDNVDFAGQSPDSGQEQGHDYGQGAHVIPDIVIPDVSIPDINATVFPTDTSANAGAATETMPVTLSTAPVSTPSLDLNGAISDGPNLDNSIPVNAPSIDPSHADDDAPDGVSGVPTVVADSNTSAVDVPGTVTEAPTMVFSPSALADAAAEANANAESSDKTSTMSTSAWLYPDDAAAASARHGGDIVDTSWGIEPIQFPASVTGETPSDDATKPFGDLPQFAGPSSAPDDFEHSDKPALAALAGTGFSDDMVEEEKPEEKKKSPWVIVAIVVAILVVIGLIVGVFVYWNSLKKDSAHSDAMTQCIAANNRVTIANEKLSKALSSTKDAQGIAGDQVADANTVNTLKTAVETAGSMEKAKSCTYLTSADQLNTAAKDNRTLADKIEKTATAVTDAAKAVTDSKQQKEIDTAKKQLQDLVGTAQQTMTDSEGEVSDESTRTALQSAIDAANGVLGKTDATVDDLNKAKSDLQSAVDAVKKSMDEYQAALEAQRQAESDDSDSSNSNSNSGTTRRRTTTPRRTTSPSPSTKSSTSPTSPSPTTSSPTTSKEPTSGESGSTDDNNTEDNSNNNNGNGGNGNNGNNGNNGSSNTGNTDSGNGNNGNNSGKTGTSN